MLYVLVFILFDKITINLYLSIFSTHWTASNFKTIQVKIKKNRKTKHTNTDFFITSKRIAVEKLYTKNNNVVFIR